MEDRALLSTFVVSNTDDDGPGSLRQAILDANAKSGRDVIAFAVRGDGVHTIAPTSSLPEISESVLIDGRSQPGYAGTPLIELSGQSAGYAYGLTITGSHVTARGLDITGFLGAGILIMGTGASDNWIYGNFLGTDPTGTQAAPNQYGVSIGEGATQSLIGTDGDGLDDAGERNVISGNSFDIVIAGPDTEQNVVAGNFIGTDRTGTRSLGIAIDYAAGVALWSGASSNWIGVNPLGGSAIEDEGNVISGHHSDGVQIAGSGTKGNVVAGNRIGTDTAGTAPLPNAIGVEFYDGASQNTIGGIAAGAGNLIANNTHAGVWVDDGSLGNSILANRIFANTGPAIGFSSNPQAPPIIAQMAGGQLAGWLGGRAPHASFDLDFFASAAFAADGSGQAERYLGSLQITTDGEGQAVFEIPYAPPPDRPVLTATATDPQGSTSALSIQRGAAFRGPTSPVRLLPGRSRIFSASSGGAISLRQASAGPLEPEWVLRLSVAAGTLTLAGTDGLVGSGDGTGTLDYRGSLGALNAALDGLIYAPPSGYQGSTTLDLDARSFGATPLRERIPVVVTSGTFLVTTAADSGPGSLRQAILDSDGAPGGMNTITFAIPGTGLRTIAPLSPLPAITTPALLDGSSQPGFVGSPLIAISSRATGNSGALSIGSSVTVRALEVDSYRTTANDPSAANEQFVARVHPEGLTTRLLLKDAQGRVLMQSDGQSAEDRDNRIDVNVPPAAFSFEVQELGGVGSYTLTITLTPATTPVRALPLGLYPFAIVTGDFNGDGRPDLAATAATGEVNGVSILLGNGDGTFRPQVAYPVRGGAGFMVPGDFDGDGHLDLAVAGNGVSMLLGNGDGTFQPPEEVAPGISGFLAAGDFDRDGHLDLAICHDNVVSVWLGNGDGTFRPRGGYQTGAVADSIVAGDFNGDGRLDMAISSGSSSADPGTVLVILGDGDGTFQPRATYDVGAGPLSLVAGDFNEDGRIDLAVTNYFDGIVSVLPGNGDGTFQPRATHAAGGEPLSLVSGDFNGDGHLDLATTGVAVNDASVLLGDGDGSFQPQVTCPAGVEPLFVVAADFNGDGQLDLATTDQGNVGEFGTDPGGVNLLLGNGDGTFQPEFEVGNAVGTSPTSIVSGDFNGDGRIDLATANRIDKTVSMLLGDGDGTFRPGAAYAVGAYPDSILTGDFNGDGRLDLALESDNYDYLTGTSVYEFSVLLGDGDGTFQPPVSYAGISLATPVSGDFNGDGHLDFAGILSGSGSDPGVVSALLGNGDGTFQPQATYVTGWLPEYVVTGDFNGDGRLDLAGAGSSFNSTTFTTTYVVSVLLGDGDGTFQPPVSYAGISPATLVSGDFDGDGRLDLAVAGLEYAYLTDTYVYEVSVLLGNGDGTLQPQAIYAVGSLPYSLVAGDFNGDGHLDLAGADLLDHIALLLLGEGDGTFQPPVSYPVGGAPSSLVSGDFNGDGHPDLAVANESSGTVSLLLGEGDGTFADPGQFAATPHATPLVADVNGDGASDVLVIDGSGDILYRKSQPGRSGSFDPPITINSNHPARDIVWVPQTDQGPVLAAVDARDDAVSLYAWRDGRFVQLGSLLTGRLPAQIIAADLNSDGWSDLVVRNAGDGTLSTYIGTRFEVRKFSGPVNPHYLSPGFLTPVTFSAGTGVSDVQAIDTTRTGIDDLVITNELSGQLGIMRNLGGGMFAPPEPYRAGAGPTAIDAGSGSPRVTSLERTAGVAAVRSTTGGPTELVTINPGSKTLGVLAGLGQGRFANPLSLYTVHAARVVRAADFNGDGIGDLAVLTAEALRIDLGNGQGSFAAPVAYDAGLDPTGLTDADVNRDGHPDLLIGNAYGDVLALLGQDDGSFRPYRKADQAVALAVADLTGDGKPEFIYVDQGLDRVAVQYGTDQAKILGDHSTGLLSPGAVALADLTGDGIPDLIVANSGSNNVLVYPGTGDGEFAPAANGGHGFFTGTNPTGLAVADLNGDGRPDLLVANSGSNDVSVLLGQGSGATWTMTPGPRIKTDAGPVAVAAGDILGTGRTDLAVANREANTVQVFPGLGGGFFNDQAPRSYAVGQAPGGLFLGNFDGAGSELAALNAGSNSVTLIGPGGVIGSFATGGQRPTSGLAGDFNGDGLTDLVVGNGGDGRLALLLGGPGGLSLAQATSSAEAPAPTALSFGGLSGGVLSFYVASAGREAAAHLAFDLTTAPGAEPAVPGIPIAPAPSPPAGAQDQAAVASVQAVGQLLSVTGTALDLVTTLLSVATVADLSEADNGGGGAIALVAGFQPAAGGAPGQGISAAVPEEDEGGDEAEGAPEAGAGPAAEAVVGRLPAWARLAIGLARAWKQARAEELERAGQSESAPGLPGAGPDTARPPGLGPSGSRRTSETGSRDEPEGKADTPAAANPMGAPGDGSAMETSASDVIDASLESLSGGADHVWWPILEVTRSAQEPAALWNGLPAHPIAIAAALAACGAIAWKTSADRPPRRLVRKIRGRPASTCGCLPAFRPDRRSCTRTA